MSVQDVSSRTEAGQSDPEFINPDSVDLYIDFFEKSPAGSHVLGPDGRVEKMNQAELDMIGYSASEIIGKKSWMDLILQEQRAIFKDHWEKISNPSIGEIRDLKYTLVHKGGQHVHVILNASGNFNQQGQLIHTRGIVIDVTDIKRLETQLSHSERLSNIGELAGGVAHDVNNHLTVILGNAEILRATGEYDEKTLDSIIDASKKCAQLSTRLLAFARKEPASWKIVDPNSLAREVVKLLGSTIPKTIKIEAQYSKQSLQIVADSVQLETALQNLAINAWHAMPSGGILGLTVDQVYLQEPLSGYHEVIPGEHVRFRMIDTGVGMDTQTLRRIFEPFYTTKGPDKGTGLGLAQVHGYVSQHRGYITAESVVGEGSVFSIYFPCVNGDLESSEDLTDEVTQCTGQVVLLVDDEPAIRDIGCTMLLDEGHHILTAKDGEEAIQMFTEERGEIEVIVLDWDMPLIDGLHALTRIRSFDSKVPVIVCTGDLDLNLEMVAGLGVQEIVRKPFTKHALCSAVARAQIRKATRSECSDFSVMLNG